MTDQHSHRPPAFDLAVFWNQWSDQWKKLASSHLRPYLVFVRVAPTLVPYLVRRYGDEIEEQIEQVAQSDRAGWIELTFNFETEEEALSHILSFGSLAEVLQPHDVRKKIAQIAATLLTFY